MVMAAMMMVGGGIAMGSLASGQRRRTEKAVRKESALLTQQMEDAEYEEGRLLQKMESYTDTLRGQQGKRDAFMEQAVLSGTRRTTGAELARQQSAAGMSGAARLQAGQVMASAQAQGLLAMESARQTRERELNQIVSANLQQAANIEQQGWAVEQQTRAQLAGVRANLLGAQIGADAEVTKGMIGGLGGMVGGYMSKPA